MQEFEDLGPEYRQGTYFGRLPKELRQLATRYEESCNYSVDIHTTPDPDKKTIGILNRGLGTNYYIPFQRGITNNITMKEFIFNVKQDIDVEYRVSHYFYIGNFTKKHIGLYIKEQLPYILPVAVIKLCRELEEILMDMEVFQKS